MSAEKYERDGISLYRADCFEWIPTIKVPVMCVVTDPPYDVHAGAGGGFFGGRDHLTNTGGFTDGGCDYSFLASFKNWFSFCSRKQLRDLLTVAENCERYNVLVWCKSNPVPTCNNKYLPDVEFIVHGFESGRLFGDVRIKSSFMVQPCGMKQTEHPNEKPLKLIEKLVGLGTQKGEIVCDPFMGSGTTAVASIRMGRKFIGCEKEQKWFDVACARVDSELDSGGFVLEDSKPKVEEQVSFEIDI